jgi:acetylornithine deacetylase
MSQPRRDGRPIDEVIDEHGEEWAGLFRTLLAQRSVFEQEHGVLAVLEQWFVDRGIRYERVEHRREVLEQLPGAVPPFSTAAGRHSLVARAGGTGNGRSLAFNAHLDIVPEGDRAAWTRDPFAAEIDPGAGVIYGRGAMDDRAGVVIAAALLQIMTAGVVTLLGDVVFQFVLEDETTGNGTLLCLHAGHRTDAAVIIDGTRLDRAVVSHAGQLQFTIISSGRPASVSVSHVGCNAAEILADALLRLKAAVFARNASRAKEWEVFPSPFQFVTLGFNAPITELTVPTHATATCYVTFPPPESITGMREFVQRTLDAAGAGGGGSLAIEWSGIAVNPVDAQGDELPALLQAAVVRNGLAAPVLSPSTGTSDLRHFARAGIPAMLYGPGRGFNPHRPDEHYYLADLPTMIRIFVDLATAWCGGRQAS